MGFIIERAIQARLAGDTQGSQFFSKAAFIPPCGTGLCRRSRGVSRWFWSFELLAILEDQVPVVHQIPRVPQGCSMPRPPTGGPPGGRGRIQREEKDDAMPAAEGASLQTQRPVLECPHKGERWVDLSQNSSSCLKQKSGGVSTPKLSLACLLACSAFGARRCPLTPALSRYALVQLVCWCETSGGWRKQLGPVVHTTRTLACTPRLVRFACAEPHLVQALRAWSDPIIVGPTACRGVPCFVSVRRLKELKEPLNFNLQGSPLQLTSGASVVCG